MSLYYCLSVRTGAALTLAWSILYSAANLAIAASHVVGLFRRRLFQKYSQKLSALKNILICRRYFPISKIGQNSFIFFRNKFYH